MTAMLYLVPLALILGVGALATFLWALSSGQYDDLDAAAQSILYDDPDEDHAIVDQAPRQAAPSALDIHG
jgi:cbb3-type cytochrome oxidase maturation protein